jgi:S1-C subfamily serine protease
VQFVEHDVSRDRTAAEEMVRVSGQRGVPVITVDGRVVVGFNRPLLEELLSRRKAPSLGIMTADAGRVASRFNLTVTSGAYVGKTNPGSAAVRAGLQEGDVIVELAGRPVRTADELKGILAGLSPGSRVPVSWVRAGQAMKGEVAL